MERIPGESTNDQNDRAIRVATKWYDNHLSSSKKKQEEKVRAILLTDDMENKRKAESEGLLACSVTDYVRAMTDHPQLQDKLAHKDFDIESTKVALFSPHLTPNEIHDGIKKGKYVQGSFMASRENYLEGSVNVEGYEKFVSYAHFDYCFSHHNVNGFI